MRCTGKGGHNTPVVTRDSQKKIDNVSLLPLTSVIMIPACAVGGGWGRIEMSCTGLFLVKIDLISPLPPRV